MFLKFFDKMCFEQVFVDGSIRIHQIIVARYNLNWGYTVESCGVSAGKLQLPNNFFQRNTCTFFEFFFGEIVRTF